VFPFIWSDEVDVGSVEMSADGKEEQEQEGEGAGEVGREA